MPYRLIITGWVVGMGFYIFVSKYSNKNVFKYADLSSRIKKGKRIDKTITKSIDDNNLF